MPDIIQQLQTRTSLLQEKIEAQKKLEGAKEQLLVQLQEMGIATIEDGQTTIAELDTQLEGITNEITATISKMDILIAGPSAAPST